MSVSTTTLNQYVGAYPDGTSLLVDAETIVDAADALSLTAEPQTIVKTHTGILVQVETVDVAFTTAVSPSGAVTAGCKAAPDSYTVPDGTSVIFTAMPATGYTFTEWRLGATVLSTSATIALTVTQADPVNNPALVYTAVFAAITP